LYLVRLKFLILDFIYAKIVGLLTKFIC
jgi:hypothetical protein